MAEITLNQELPDTANAESWHAAFKPLANPLTKLCGSEDEFKSLHGV